MREWLVGGAVLLAEEGVLLVRNQRRNGSHDWTPPGGVIEVHEGESLLDGLTREVEEETGLRVTEWAGMLYHVRTEAPGLGWLMTAEIHLAASWEGELRVDDPDGIVVEAGFVAVDRCAGHLDGGHRWVGEPLSAWLGERWVDGRRFGYRVDGADVATLTVTRLE